MRFSLGLLVFCVGCQGLGPPKGIDPTSPGAMRGAPYVKCKFDGTTMAGSTVFYTTEGKYDKRGFLDFMDTDVGGDGSVDGRWEGKWLNDVTFEDVDTEGVNSNEPLVTRTVTRYQRGAMIPVSRETRYREDGTTDLTRTEFNRLGGTVREVYDNGADGVIETQIDTTWQGDQPMSRTSTGRGSGDNWKGQAVWNAALTEVEWTFTGDRKDEGEIEQFAAAGDVLPIFHRWEYDGVPSMELGTNWDASGRLVGMRTTTYDDQGQASEMATLFGYDGGGRMNHAVVTQTRGGQTVTVMETDYTYNCP